MRTRRGRRAVLLSLFFLLFLCLFTTHASAQTVEDILPELIEILPESEHEDWGEVIDDPAAAGKLLGAEYLLSFLGDTLTDGLAESSGSFFRLLGISLLFALLSHMAKTLGSEAAVRAAECGIGVILTLFLFRLAGEDIARASAALLDMRRFSDGLIPLFAVLYAAGGSAGTATAAAAGFATFSYLLEHILAGVLLPFLHLLFAFTALSVLGVKLGTAGFFAALRRSFLTLLTLLSTLLVASLGFQTTLSASADSLAAGSVRFAVGNLIPIVGGTLGGTLRTLSASLSMLRRPVATLSVAALIFSILPVLVALLLHRLYLSLAAAVSGMLGADRAKRIFEDFRSVYDLAAATLSVGCVLFFLILGILARCAIAI